MADLPSAQSIKAHGKGCWYYISTWTCVLCGRWEEVRERRTDPKPEHWGDRHDHTESACGDHFC